MPFDAGSSNDDPGTDALEPGLAGRDAWFGLDRPPPQADWLVGAELGGVTLVRVLGDGGMGRVFEGLQHQPRRERRSPCSGRSAVRSPMGIIAVSSIAT